ncbi:hypothetical protein ABZ508_26485 [Streptomyces lavendulocolor]|uniref:Uncharacterized protein n=1 Tax=Streptomyces lavendulocolor TaxID=67316 RepID=A0ABV2WC10_9ACTN
MSLTTPWRGRGQHRAADEIQRLREENRRHLTWRMAADDAFALLQQERREALDLADQLRTRAIEAETAADCALADAEAMRAELLELRAFKANATAISAPASTRDIDPGDQPTQPIPVLTLQQAHGIGPVLPVRDPGRVPSWADPAA